MTQAGVHVALKELKQSCADVLLINSVTSEQSVVVLKVLSPDLSQFIL